jgi:hypothetical protein
MKKALERPVLGAGEYPNPATLVTSDCITP